MKRRLSLVLPALILSMLMAATSSVAAQVATLRTPDPDAEASAAPAEEIDGQEAILQFTACLRDNGVDLPDPQFGAEGGFFGGDGGEFGGIDFMSRDFLAAMQACQHLLEALRPEIDPEQQAEQTEEMLAFAECMRAEGIDFPDPDPIRGLTLGSMRGEDGGLAFDPFSPEFQEASTVCVAKIGMEVPGGASAPAS
ncbi:MAG: hypothetical protein U9O18_06855 [Chloroflexota bacterium]|nr:hypothetical protein [Chloroflexota bacterium]